jgi:hypothetical protein
MYHHRGGNSANKSHETEKLPNRCVVGGCSNITIQRKTFHFILYLLLETRCPKRKGDGLISRTLNEQYEIQCSLYFAKKEFTGKTTVSYRRNWFRSIFCESQENGICIIDTLISFIMHFFEYAIWCNFYSKFVI